MEISRFPNSSTLDKSIDPVERNVQYDLLILYPWQIINMDFVMLAYLQKNNNSMCVVSIEYWEILSLCR